MTKNNFLVFLALFLFAGQIQTMSSALRSLYSKQSVKANNKRLTRKFTDQKKPKNTKSSNPKTVKSLLKINERYERNNKEIPSYKLKKRIEKTTEIHNKQRDYSLGLYLLGFIGGVYVWNDIINYFDEHDFEQEILEAGYEYFLQTLFSDPNHNIDEQCKNLVGMDFNALEQFFENEIGISLKDVVITTLLHKKHGLSIEAALGDFQKELITNEDTKKHFLKITSKLLYSTICQNISKNANTPEWIKEMGVTEDLLPISPVKDLLPVKLIEDLSINLVEELSKSYATSVYEYVTSSEFIPFISKLEKNIDTDVARFKSIEHAAIHTGGNMVLSQISSLTTACALELGAVRAVCLISPLLGIPLDIVLRCNNKKLRPILHKMIENVQLDFDPAISKHELPINQVDTNPHYYDVIPFMRKVYLAYFRDNDLAGTLTESDLPFKSLEGLVHHELNNARNDFENESVPLVKKTIYEIFNKKSNEERLREIGKDVLSDEERLKDKIQQMDGILKKNDIVVADIVRDQAIAIAKNKTISVVTNKTIELIKNSTNQQDN